MAPWLGPWRKLQSCSSGVSPARSNYRHSLLHSWSSLMLSPPSSCVTTYLETCPANLSREEVARYSELSMDCDWGARSVKGEGVIPCFLYTSTLCLFLSVAILFPHSYQDCQQPKRQINYLQLKSIFKKGIWSFIMASCVFFSVRICDDVWMRQTLWNIITYQTKDVHILTALWFRILALLILL